MRPGDDAVQQARCGKSAEEEVEERSVREFMRQKQKMQQVQQKRKKKSNDGWER